VHIPLKSLFTDQTTVLKNAAASEESESADAPLTGINYKVAE